MNKQLRGLVGMLACVGISTIDARTISTPLPLYLGWPAAHVYYPVNDMEEPINECGYDIDIWGAGYYRSAIDAYGPKNKNKNCDPCAKRNDSVTTNPITGLCTSTKRESLGALIFGASSFAIAQSFANSTVGTGLPLNPFVTFATLSPSYDYREFGAFFGLILGKRFGCNDQWRAGVRFALPYRDVEMEQTACSNTTGESLQDVFRQRTETITFPGGDGGALISETNVAFAARLDFLSSLDNVIFNAMGNTVPLVIYSDPNNAGHISIAGQDITGGLTSAQPPVTDIPSLPPVEAIESVDGSVPSSVRWADFPTNGPTVIAANGTGLTNLQRGRFVADNVYTPLGSNVPQQEQLWIVPSLDSDGTIDGVAETIRTAIITAIEDLDAGVGAFLASRGIDLCEGRRKGIGDLDIQLYVGHHCDCGFGELQLGVRVPTGKKIRTGLTPIAQPLGNNGHVEIRPGIVLGTSYWDWVKFKIDATYSFVLNKTEQVAAPFVGATIRNIGPSVPAKVSWGYFWGEIDMTIVNPCNPCMGATIAYQPYAKRKDKICFPCTQVVDFIGNIQTLDATILTNNTNRVGHTIRTELFYEGSCYNLFLGFAQVVGGHNITRDTDLYLGGFVTF